MPVSLYLRFSTSIARPESLPLSLGGPRICVFRCTHIFFYLLPCAYCSWCSKVQAEEVGKRKPLQRCVAVSPPAQKEKAPAIWYGHIHRQLPHHCKALLPACSPSDSLRISRPLSLLTKSPCIPSSVLPFHFCVPASAFPVGVTALVFDLSNGVVVVWVCLPAQPPLHISLCLHAHSHSVERHYRETAEGCTITTHTHAHRERQAQFLRRFTFVSRFCFSISICGLVEVTTPTTACACVLAQRRRHPLFPAPCAVATPSLPPP